MDLIESKAMGRRLVLAVSDGKTLPDQTIPLVKRFVREVNSRMDQARVLHGAHTDFSGLPGEGAVAFLPDGNVLLLPDRKAVHAFCQSIGRATRAGEFDGAGVTVGVE